MNLRLQIEVLFLVFNILPYFWAKTSLSVSTTPKNLERGDHIFFSVSLGVDDVADKPVTLVVTNTQGNTMVSLSTNTHAEGFYNYTWHIPDDCSIGKHSITVSSELLTATDNFMVKLAAPQKYGRNILGNW